jgi:HD-like signal output (HDOD) protein
MTSFISPGNNKKLHPAFSGLNDRQVTALYKEDHIRQLEPGECLFSEGDMDENTYLIINGEIQIQQIRQGLIYPLTQIDNSGHIARDMFSNQGQRSAMAIVKQPVTTLVFDDTTLNAMDKELQAVLFCNLGKSLSHEINTLYATQADVLHKNTYLSHHLATLLRGNSSQYEDSPAVKNLLKRVPKLPPYASQLTIMLMSEDASAKDVTGLARLDPSLTGAILKTVNSAYYGLSQKVIDVHHATLLLGFNQVYQVIINLGIQKTMPKTGQFKRLQSHSVLISILCFEISLATRQGNAPVMNTIGLLHDIRKSVLLLLIKQNPKLAFFISLLDPARIGAMLLENWEIPQEIYSVLAYQKYPESLPPEMIPEASRKPVSILYLAHLCQEYLAGNSRLSTCFLHDYFEELGIREKTLDTFIDKQLLPAINKRLSTYPTDVQEFMAAASNTCDKESLTENH